MQLFNEKQLVIKLCQKEITRHAAKLKRDNSKNSYVKKKLLAKSGGSYKISVSDLLIPRNNISNLSGSQTYT